MVLLCLGDRGGNTLDGDRGGFVLVQLCVEGVGTLNARQKFGFL